MAEKSLKMSKNVAIVQLLCLLFRKHEEMAYHVLPGLLAQYYRQIVGDFNKLIRVREALGQEKVQRRE